MRKILLGLLFSGMLFVGGNVYANEESMLTVKTETVDQALVNYATDNLSFYLKGMIKAEEGEGSLLDYKLSSPFSLLEKRNENNLTLFPITKDGKIEYIFYIKKENEGYSSKLSRMMVDELNSLISQGKGNSVVLVASEDGSIYYEGDTGLSLLWQNPDPEIQGSKENSAGEVLDEYESKDLDMISLNDTIDYVITGSSEVVKDSNSKLAPRSTTVNKFGTSINWKISENQQGNNWCMAYATTMILINKNDARATKVSDVVKWGKKGKNDGFTPEEIIKYANTRGVYPKLLERPTTWTESLKEFRKSNGLLGLWKSQVNTFHAIDLLGTYSENYMGKQMNGYVIWNPWNKYTEIVDASPKQIKYIANSTRTYTWIGTITNW
ncbi:C47 family peptidase [Enterococcus wangshanyuanii]|uniref:Staphopain A n=1 Tax=Enterococcus wangshanyuanii TaxID=2005703 RepID=A0ABQ1P888_9ENTE|nr:C47 family peptidase [Enterococcus wangshanyuanii]GGC91306.1 staphopain A [Enterococcus wangshanyuanii]